MNKALPQDLAGGELGHLGWWYLALGVFAIDHLIKLAVEIAFPFGERVPIFSFFNLVYALNADVLVSFLAYANAWQRYFLIACTLYLSLWLGARLLRFMPGLQAAAYSLILGGTLSNAVDGVVQGYVVDYLDVQWATSNLPAFNVADLSITCGLVLLMATALRRCVGKIMRPRG